MVTGSPHAEMSAIDLTHENAKLTKIVNALMARVECSTDAQGNAFSLFQAAITLESTVRQRTAELQKLNHRLVAEITERRAIERALSVAKTQAEHANTGKSEYLAAASHDLLQPLNVARLFLDALAERPLDATSSALVERVARSLESADELLRTLLEMSRLDAGALQADMQDVALDPLLRALAAQYGLAADERGLRLRIVPSEAYVRSDPHLLERVVRNLLANALRYTHTGGVLVGARQRGDRVVIEVWDTGPGIPASDLRAIFCQFTRLAGPVVPDALPGMGLGLAIVERIAPLIDATIGVRSRVGRGSVFALSVPAIARPLQISSAPPGAVVVTPRYF